MCGPQNSFLHECIWTPAELKRAFLQGVLARVFFEGQNVRNGHKGMGLRLIVECKAAGYARMPITVLAKLSAQRLRAAPPTGRTPYPTSGPISSSRMRAVLEKAMEVIAAMRRAHERSSGPRIAPELCSAREMDWLCALKCCSRTSKLCKVHLRTLQTSSSETRVFN